MRLGCRSANCTSSVVYVILGVTVYTCDRCDNMYLLYSGTPRVSWLHSDHRTSWWDNPVYPCTCVGGSGKPKRSVPLQCK